MRSKIAAAGTGTTEVTSCLMSVLFSARFPRQERMAEDLEGAGLLLALRATERVDRRSDPHLDKARLLEELLPACARQATGNSAGP
jgi:hypothetical protein